MSNTTSKNLLLSQQKVGQNSEGNTTAILSHTKTVEPGKKEGETFEVFQVEIPGVDPSTVSIECENYTLRISCERGNLSIPVTPTTDLGQIKADILWGMLTLTIPQPLPPAPQAIKVSIHDAVKKAPTKVTEREEG